MKRIFALLLCFVLVASLFAGCRISKQNPSVLQTFSQSLTTSGYTFVTTTGPDGTTTVELVPPGVSTKPTTNGTSQQSTTKPTTNGTSQPSVQPTGQPSSSTKPGDPTGQYTSTVTVPLVTTDPPVLVLAEKNLMLTALGATYNIHAGDIPANAILWISQNEAVATVKDGVVTARGMGTTRIYANFGDQTVYCTVTVQLPTTDPAPTLKLRYTTLLLLQGNSQSIYNGTIPVTSITWKSSNTRVATVKDGTVKAVGPGSAVITATWQGQTAQCTITVQQPTTEPTTDPVVELKLTHTSLTLLVGNSANLYNGSIPAGEITWTTTNAQIVSVNNGRITALRAGQAVIQAEYKGQRALCTVTVQQVTTDPTTGTTTKPTTTASTTVSSGTHKKLDYTGRYLYQLLPSQEQGWYRAIDAAVNSLQNDVRLTGSFTDPKWYTIYFAYMFDNPEHFYLGAKVAYSSSGKVMFSYSDGTTNSFNGTAVPSITDAMRQNIRTRKAAFDAEVNRIISAIPANIPDVEKELMIYDRLLIDMSYNVDAVTNDRWDGFAEVNWSAYGGIINKTGVCEAYAEAFQTLCYAVGINCTGVIGTAQGSGHKWNAVQLDGEWYQCDVTFDDPVNGKPGVAQFHSYFNITSAKILSEHSISGSDYPGPTCTATKYSYKTYFG